VRIAAAIFLVLAGSAVIVRGLEDLADGTDRPPGRLIGAFIGGPFLVALGFWVRRGRRPR
jgi:hypothetical protein